MADHKDEIYDYQPLWGNWYIDMPIGKGSFGSVYKIAREEMGHKYTSAVKIISIPSEEQYREAEASFGHDEETLTGYFEDVVKNIVSEVNLLYSLGGNSNIVAYHDHKVIKKEDRIGWDVLIRMEYVTSLRNYLANRQMAREETVRLGIDICSALELCSRKGIIHRDIKDENIFVNDDGVFKIGDFGIARELSKSGRAASMRGTPLYMAPEVFRGDKYDSAVDIYSLGIVLYKLLNDGRMPFMPQYPQAIRFKDSEEALEKRMTGEPLPLPVKSGEAFGKVILKACAYKAADRYGTATGMKRELEAVLAGMTVDEREEKVTIAGTKKEMSGKAENDTQKLSEENIAQTAAIQEDLNKTVSIFGKSSEEDEDGNKTVSIFDSGNIDGQRSDSQEEQKDPKQNIRSDTIFGDSNAAKVPNDYTKENIVKPSISGSYFENKNKSSYALAIGFVAFALLFLFIRFWSMNNDKNVVLDNTDSLSTVLSVSAIDKIDTSQPVTFKLTLLGDKPEESDLVYGPDGAVNKLLKEKINTTLDVNYIPWENMSEQYSLILASGAFDMIFSADWMNYYQSAENNFMELTPEMMETYSPRNWESTPQVAWDMAKIKGKVYFLPSPARGFPSMMLAYRGDLAEKYGFVNGELKSLDDFNSYCDFVAKSEKSIKAVAVNKYDNGYYNLMKSFSETEYIANPVIGYKISDQYKVLNLLDMPEYINAYIQCTTAYKKGYWSNNLSEESSADLFINGNAATFINSQYEALQQAVNNSNPDWHVKLTDLNLNTLIRGTQYASLGITLNRYIKNPERALMAIDLLRYDKELNDIVSLGIEGRNWISDGDNQYTVVAGYESKYPAYGPSSWPWWSIKKRIGSDLNSWMDQWQNKGRVVECPMISLSNAVNYTNIQQQVNNIRNISTTFEEKLRNGNVTNVDATISDWKTQLESNEINTVIDEIQRQVDDLKP